MLEYLQEQGFIVPVTSTDPKPPDIGLRLALALEPVPTSDPKPSDICRSPALADQQYTFGLYALGHNFTTSVME